MVWRSIQGLADYCGSWLRHVLSDARAILHDSTSPDAATRSTCTERARANRKCLRGRFPSARFHLGGFVGGGCHDLFLIAIFRIALWRELSHSDHSAVG